MMKRRISVAIVLLFLSATTIASSAEEVNEETGEMIVNLKVIDAKFDWMRIEAHSIVSKIVRGDDSSFSNDDPDFLDQLFDTSNKDEDDDDRTKSTQLPSFSPSKQSEMSMTPVSLSAHSIVPTEQVITSPTHQHEVNEEDGEYITTNEVEYSASPTANAVAAVNGKPTSIPTVISNIPSVSVTNKTYWPTYSPLPLHPHSTNNSPTPTLKEVMLDVCPPTYNESIWYIDGDDVAIRRKPRCQTKHCQTVYRCKSVYCNIVMPGTRDANKGWSKLGRCNDSGSNEASELESYTPTSNPVVQDIGIVVTTELPTTASTNMTVASSSARPVSSPIILSNDTKPTYTPTPIVLDEDHDSRNNTIVGYNVSDDDSNLIKMDLPFIISDITLCSSLLSKMKNTRILSSTIRSMMSDLFETLLMQDLVNIWMKVEVELNNETVNSDKMNTTTTVRLHAYFDGTAFFSPKSSSPTYDELSSLLVQYFDATEFERQLSLPFTTGNNEVPNCPEDMLVDVNSMYLTLDDGLLIPLGLAYEEMFSSSTSTAGAMGPTKDDTLGPSSSLSSTGLGTQLIVFLSTITGEIENCVYFTASNKALNYISSSRSNLNMPVVAYFFSACMLSSDCHVFTFSQ